MSAAGYDRDLDLPPPPPNRPLWGNGNPDLNAGGSGTPDLNAGGSAPVAPQQANDKSGTTPILIPVPVPLKDRMDATYAHTLGFTGFKSKRDFQRAAFEHFCAHLEATYNKGNQYPLAGQQPA